MKKISILVLFLFSMVALPFAQETKSNDDPWQKFPDGVEESIHRHIDANGGKVEEPRVHPPFWWTGMVHSKLEILLYDQNIKDYEVEIDYPGVEVTKVNRVQNPNYLFVEITIGPGTKAGEFLINLEKGTTKKSYPYELKTRIKGEKRIQGLNSSDLIYLIMPDRFANGDRNNDSYEDMRQSGVKREKFFFRHGGDLVGIMEHLDYLEELGVTAIWLNPVVENDQPYESYHGYAITDHYQMDKRFGTNEDYLQLVEACHARGIKVIMDIIHNHVGDQHWFIQDLPSEDWIHQFDQFTKTTYRAPTLMDPYVAEADKMRMTDGWFDHHMPDINQQNKHVANYLIQNHIWWVEYSGQDAYRIDTYAYNDQDFMAEWGRRLKKEFPSLGIFGETWVHGAPVQAQFTQNNHLREEYNSHLPGVTDFQLYYAIMEALNREQGWTEGVARIYFTLAKDFLYEDPNRNVIFLDNHDLGRLYSVLGESMTKFKSAMALLMTMRGIPMIYYGTEILLKGEGGAFGEAGRIDFPGGWQSDKTDKFNENGRTSLENEAFNYVKTLANYRKATPALHSGKLMQFVPENGVYVYFRYDYEKTVMVIYNSNNKKSIVPTARYKERMAGFTSAKDVISGKVLSGVENIEVGANTSLILEMIH